MTETLFPFIAIGILLLWLILYLWHIIRGTETISYEEFQEMIAKEAKKDNYMLQEVKYSDMKVDSKYYPPKNEEDKKKFIEETKKRVSEAMCKLLGPEEKDYVDFGCTSKYDGYGPENNNQEMKKMRREIPKTLKD